MALGNIQVDDISELKCIANDINYKLELIFWTRKIWGKSYILIR